MGVELSTDPQVSEDVRQSVGRDVASLRENHSNVDELLKSQRDRCAKSLMSRIVYWSVLECGVVWKVVVNSGVVSCGELSYAVVSCGV